MKKEKEEMSRPITEDMRRINTYDETGMCYMVEISDECLLRDYPKVKKNVDKILSERVLTERRRREALNDLANVGYEK